MAFTSALLKANPLNPSSLDKTVNADLSLSDTYIAGFCERAVAYLASLGMMPATQAKEAY